MFPHGQDQCPHALASPASMPSCAPTSKSGLPLTSKPGKLLSFYSGPNTKVRRRLSSRSGRLLRAGVFLFPAALESEAVPVHFQDVNMMGESIQQCTGQPLRAQHLGPLGKGQVAGYQCGSPFVTLTEDFEQYFGTLILSFQAVSKKQIDDPAVDPAVHNQNPLHFHAVWPGPQEINQIA